MSLTVTTTRAHTYVFPHGPRCATLLMTLYHSLDSQIYWEWGMLQVTQSWYNNSCHPSSSPGWTTFSLRSLIFCLQLLLISFCPVCTLVMSRPKKDTPTSSQAWPKHAAAVSNMSELEDHHLTNHPLLQLYNRTAFNAPTITSVSTNILFM